MWSLDWPSRYVPCVLDAIEDCKASLQKTKRTGWIRMGIDGPESIADHMYRMGLMALLAGDSGVDGNK